MTSTEFCATALLVCKGEGKVRNWGQGGAGLTSNRRRRNKDVVDVATAAVIMMIGCGVTKCAARQWNG